MHVPNAELIEAIAHAILALAFLMEIMSALREKRLRNHLRNRADDNDPEAI